MLMPLQGVPNKHPTPSSKGFIFFSFLSANEAVPICNDHSIWQKVKLTPIVHWRHTATFCCGLWGLALEFS